MQENLREGRYVSKNGGSLDFVTPDGEILLSVAVPPGIVPAADYLDLCPEGAEVQVSKGLVLVLPRGRAAVHRCEDMYESGANPDYQPTSADRLERQMRHTMLQMQAETKALNAKVAALSAIERMPQAPAPEPAKPKDDNKAGEVVE